MHLRFLESAEHLQNKRMVSIAWRIKTVKTMKIFLTLLSVSAIVVATTVTLVEPAQAQWGLMYPDGSIRNRGVLVGGPNPGHILDDRLVLPINKSTIDLTSGSISRGNRLVGGPNPGRRLQVCMQTGLCYKTACFMD